jgi:hypothetical protein
MSEFLRSRHAVVLFLGALSSVVVPRTASAQDAKKAACAAAYEQSQELRVGGKLLKSKEALTVCADEACPAFVRTDCAQWLTEVTRDLPTVVFSVKDEKGEDATAVRVTVDGEPFLTELDGSSVSIDPGKHVFQFEIDGAPPVKKEIEVRQAEKDRAINVSFAPRAAEAAPAVSPYGDVPKDEEKKEPVSTTGKAGPLRPYAFVAGGVGVAGVAGFIILGAMGRSKQSDLDASCGPTHSCNQSDVDAIKTKYLLADVSLGLGIAGLGAGVALFFLSQPKTDEPKNEDASLLHLDVRTRRDGAVATVSGSF